MVITTEIDTGITLDNDTDDRDYEDEVLCCEWIPDVTTIASGVTGYEQQLIGALRLNFAEADIDAFLSRMYLCQE